MGTNDANPLEVHSLFRTLPTLREDRWALLNHFFTAWYGQLGPTDSCTPQSICAAEQRLQIAFPAALCEWYELAGRRKAVWSCQDHFLDPKEVRIENDKLIICIENQDVVKWAIPLNALPDNDPPVFVFDQRDSRRWIEETPSVSVFALSQMLLNVKFSASTTFCANGQATDASIGAISENYQKLDFPDLNWPPHPTRIYGGTDFLIETNAETWIWVSALSLKSFRAGIELIGGAGVVWEQMRGF